VRDELQKWSNDPFLASAARELIQTRLAVSGKTIDANFELPGNLAAYLVTEELPWAQILTADHCVTNGGKKRDCDTEAPFASGVLATRAYMKSRASRFNLTRASTMMRFFACRDYPLPDDLEPRLPKEMLIPMFRADSADEQTDPRAEGAFGNGDACYNCHGQFSAHAQMFVRFNQKGMWKEDATGLQDPEGELGRSTGGLFTSHFEDPLAASLPAGQLFGQGYDDLPGAAKILSESEDFRSCQAKNLLLYALRLDVSTPFEKALLDDLALRLAEIPDATFTDYLVESLSHPRVVEAATFPRRSEP